MKFNLNKGTVTLTSESQDEALILFALATREIPPKVEETEPKVRKHKPHLLLKTCEICKKAFKGNRALAIHKAGAHKIYSQNHELYKKHRLAKKARKEALNGQTAITPFEQIWK